METTETTPKIPNHFAMRLAYQVIERSDELEGSRGKSAINLAKKVLTGTSSAKDEAAFARLKDFIVLSFL